MSDTVGFSLFLVVLWFGFWGPIIWAMKRWQEKNR